MVNIFVLLFCRGGIPTDKTRNGSSRLEKKKPNRFDYGYVLWKNSTDLVGQLLYTPVSYVVGISICKLPMYGVPGRAISTVRKGEIDYVWK